jgi:hypothetical protein
MLGIWNDIDPGDEREFNDWYTREHLPERLAIPGFRRGRRYVRWEDEQPSAQKYLTLYETESVETLASAPYLDRLDNRPSGLAESFPDSRGVREPPAESPAASVSGSEEAWRRCSSSRSRPRRMSSGTGC